MTTATNPVDPEVKIPAAVRAASARADELHKQAFTTDAETTPANPEGGDDGKSTTDPGTATAPKATEAAPSAPAPQTVTTEGNDQTFEHKYNSLMGRFKKQQEQMGQMASQISNLQGLLSSLSDDEDVPPRRENPELSANRLITKEDEDEYGSEFLGVVGRKAVEEVSPLVAKLEKHIRSLESKLGQVGHHVETDAKSRMEHILTENVPSWKELNYDENFISWLQLPDTYSGAIRHDLLKEAYERNDGPRVLAFFKGFLAEEAALAPTGGKPDVPGETGKVPLETFAAPGRAKTAATTGAPAEKPTFTRAQIAKFYADAAAGKYRGKEAEKERLERDIFEAQNEGRVR